MLSIQTDELREYSAKVDDPAFAHALRLAAETIEDLAAKVRAKNLHGPLVVKEDVIDAVEEVDWYHLSDGRLVHGANDQYHEPLYKSADVLLAIESVPVVDAGSQWIPCSERLPDNREHDLVLTTVREKPTGYQYIPRVMEYRQSKDDWFDEALGWLKDNPDDMWEVVAWMPLPPAYKGE